MTRIRIVGVATSNGQDEFSLLHIAQTVSGVLRTSYLMGTGGLFSEGNAAGA
jgi:hypothetical protein